MRRPRRRRARRAAAVFAALVATVGAVSGVAGTAVSWTGAPLAWTQFGGTGSDIGRAVVPLPDGGTIVGGFFESTMSLGATVLTSAGGSDGFLARFDATGNAVWATAIGSTGTDVVTGAVVHPTGEMTAIGYFANSVSIGSTTLTSAGGRDGFVARFDLDGNALWADRFGGSSADSGQSIASTADGGVVVGTQVAGSATFGSTSVPVGAGQGDLDVVVARMTATGELVWLQRLGGTGPEGIGSVAVTPTEEVYVTGAFESSTVSVGATTLTNAGGADGFVARLASDGTPAWALSCAGTGDDGTMDVIADPSGGAFVFSEVEGSAVCGASGTGTPLGDVDLLLVRLDASGAVAWAQRYGGALGERGREMARGPDGTIILAGVTSVTGSSTGDAFVVAVNPDDGTERWTGTMGGSGYDVAQAVAVDADGYVFLALRFEGGDVDPGAAALQVTTAGASDVLVVTLTPDGALAPIVRPTPPVVPAYTG